MIYFSRGLDQQDYLRFIEALDWLACHHAWLAHAVVRLGTPCFCEDTQTAAITADMNAVRLLFNPAFFSGLSLEALAGVLVHEGLHLAFNHLERSRGLADPRDRRFFELGCEAVINDAIARYYPAVELPGEPVRGQALIGQDASEMSAEQVAAILRDQLDRGTATHASLLVLVPLDDHEVWGEVVKAEWPPRRHPGAGRLVLSSGKPTTLEEAAARDRMGRQALGRLRSAEGGVVRCDLKRFLGEVLRPSPRTEALWQRPSRKALGVYPEVILPTWQALEARRRVLLAIDASGSIPPSLLADAMAVYDQGIEGCLIEAVSFDTRVYPVRREGGVRGGGGTWIQAVEEYARRQEQYPDEVICFTDAWTPRPSLRHPERWLWVLPRWGSVAHIPQLCRTVFFDGQPPPQDEPVRLSEPL
ncbi:MAG: hypothetical protein GX595_11580 [Lentisphaerae bacterium]|nr:hypothetical protein [Lentisphaerota bacterium]